MPLALGLIAVNLLGSFAVARILDGQAPSSAFSGIGKLSRGHR